MMSISTRWERTRDRPSSHQQQEGPAPLTETQWGRLQAVIEAEHQYAIEGGLEPKAQALREIVDALDNAIVTRERLSEL